MRSQKMVEHVEKGQDMLLVVARLAGADVIDDHVTDFFPSHVLGKLDTQQARQQRSRAYARALQWQALPLRSGRKRPRSLQG